MRASPLELLSYYIESLRFDTMSDFPADVAPPQLRCEDIEWDLAKANLEESTCAYRLSLQLPPRDNCFPYTFEIVVVGRFRVDARQFQGEAAERLTDTNGPAVLFGAAREAIASVTGRGPYPPLCLPSITFYGMQGGLKDEAGAKAISPERETEQSKAKGQKQAQQKQAQRKRSGK
jgi:preprotein translocase subunit SecB